MSKLWCKKTVELLQVWKRNIHSPNLLRQRIVIALGGVGESRRGQPLTTMPHAIRRDHRVTPTIRDRFAHALDRMLAQQLQHTNVLARPRQPAMTLFQLASQPTEIGGQLPRAVDRRVVQAGRLALEHCQVMQGVEHLLATVVRSFVLGNHLSLGHHHDAIHIGFHRHRGKRITPRHAVAILLPGHRLVLVDLAGLFDGCIEAARWKRQG